MSVAPTTWHGTDQERVTLLAAMSNNCVCQYDDTNAVCLRRCPSHAALVEDQRFLDGLLFERRIVARLTQEEFQVESERRSGNQGCDGRGG